MNDTKNRIYFGCVIQRENGDIVVLPHEEAAKEFEKIDPAHKRLYTDAGL